LTLV